MKRLRPSAIPTVGVIGAGRMGLPIIGHLASKGFRVLRQRRRRRQAATVRSARRCAGRTISAALARCGDAILVCVGYDREVRELLPGERGLLRRAAAGTIVAILSTVQPDTVQELAKAASAAACTSSIRPSAAAAGRRTRARCCRSSAAMRQVVERLKPVLAATRRDIVHTGGVGTAQVAKAANNLILWACLVANHEALALAKRFGVDVDALRQALLISSATNGALPNWGQKTMAWAEDDMAIVAEMADEAGIALPQAGVVRELCRTLKPRRYDLDAYGQTEPAGGPDANESHYHSKKDRVFVRGIQGQYSLKEELARLRAMPRVRKGSSIKFIDGPQTFSRHYVEPKDGITQTFHLHLEEYGPGGRSQKHGHVNEAAFYILDGEGYEIHDGIRYDWKAGDIAIVHNNCVHQHFNASAGQARPRAGHQDQADVHVHEHAVPAAGRAAAEQSPRPVARASRCASARKTSITATTDSDSCLQRLTTASYRRTRRWRGTNRRRGSRAR